jgi:hypothetical protein
VADTWQSQEGQIRAHQTEEENQKKSEIIVDADDRKRYQWK